MDSMRSLNTSLPTSRSRRSQAPDLLQAFRSAALSVTNLYKTAVTDQATTRQSGYQDALEDLLSFLDRENLGLQDGEGWKIRQWATERFEGAETTGTSMESDDDRVDLEKGARSLSPTSQARTSHEGREPHGQSTSKSPIPRTESAPPPSRKEDNDSPIAARPPLFTFSAGPNLPNRDVTMHAPDTSSSEQHSSPEPSVEPPCAQPTGPIKIEVVNRSARTQNRMPHTRHNTRSSNRDINLAGGTKRKLHLPEFFDISNVGSPRDGTSGGGKRGRYA